MENSDTTTSTTEFSNQSIVLDGDQALNYDFSHDLTVTTNDNTATVRIQQLNLISASDIQTIDGGYEIQKNGYTLKVLVNNPAGSVLFEDKTAQSYAGIAQGFQNGVNLNNTYSATVNVDNENVGYFPTASRTTFTVTSPGDYIINAATAINTSNTSIVDLSKLVGPFEYIQTSSRDMEILSSSTKIIVKNAFNLNATAPASWASIILPGSTTPIAALSVANTNTVALGTMNSTFNSASAGTADDTIKNIVMHSGATLNLSDPDLHGLTISMANDNITSGAHTYLKINSAITSTTGLSVTYKVDGANIDIDMSGSFGDKEFVIEGFKSFNNSTIIIGTSQNTYTYNNPNQYVSQTGTQNIITNITSSESFVELDGTSSDVTMSQNAPALTSNYYKVNGDGNYSIDLPTSSANIIVNSAQSLVLNGSALYTTINLEQTGLTASDIKYTALGKDGVQVTYGSTSIDIEHFIGHNIYMNVNGTSAGYYTGYTQTISDDANISSGPTISSETLNINGDANGFTYADRTGVSTNLKYITNDSNTTSGTFNIDGTINFESTQNSNIDDVINLGSAGFISVGNLYNGTLNNNTLSISDTTSNGANIKVEVNNAVDRFENGGDRLKISSISGTFSSLSKTIVRTESTVNFSSSTTNTKDIIESSDGTTAVSISDAGSNNEFLLRYSATGTVSLGENDRLLFSSNPSDYSNFSMAEKGGRYILDMTTISGAHLSVSGTSGSEIDWSNGQHIMMGAAASVLNIDNSSHVAIPLTTNT